MPEIPTTEDILAIDDPKLRLLGSGARLIADESFAVFAAGISPERVARLAGRTRRVFYDNFESRESFVRELCELFLGAEHRIVQTDPDDIAALVDMVGGDLFEAVEAIAAAMFVPVITSEASVMQLTSWAIGQSDPVVAESLSRHYAELGDGHARLFTALFAKWGLEVREPWTAEGLAGVIRAIAEGLYQQARVGLGENHLELFTLACLTVLPIATRPIGTHGDVHHRLRSFSEEAAASWREASQPSQTVNARAQVLTAIDQLLHQRGVGAIGIADVAHEAGVSVATIERAFGDYLSLVRAAVIEQIPDLGREADFDLEVDAFTVRDLIERHLRRLANWSEANAHLARAVVALPTLGRSTPQRELLDPLVAMASPLARILAAGVERDQIRNDVEPLVSASAMILMLLAANVTSGMHVIDDAVQLVTSTFLDGIAT